VERAEQAAELAGRLGLKTARWSREQEQTPAAEVLVLDKLGVLPTLFSHSFATFVGGTLVAVGGHNVLEPALAGSPVIFGPHTENTAETATLLESAGGGFCADNEQRLSELLLELLGDPERAREQGRLAQKTAKSLQGATQRTLDLLTPLFEQAGV
jgi:3-deoxy-D-manno-octulosonic-acid transferase